MAPPKKQGKRKRQTRLTFEPTADADAEANTGDGGAEMGGAGPSGSPARIRYSHGRAPSKAAPALINPPGGDKSRSRQRKLNMPVSTGRS